MKEDIYDSDRYNGLMSEYYVKMLKGTLSPEELEELRILGQRKSKKVTNETREQVKREKTRDPRLLVDCGNEPDMDLVNQCIQSCIKMKDYQEGNFWRKLMGTFWAFGQGDLRDPDYLAEVDYTIRRIWRGDRK